MGNWCMVITGIGPHGNPGLHMRSLRDVEEVMPELVDVLLKSGHSVQEAFVTMGACNYVEGHNESVFGNPSPPFIPPTGPDDD